MFLLDFALYGSWEVLDSINDGIELTKTRQVHFESFHFLRFLNVPMSRIMCSESGTAKNKSNKSNNSNKSIKSLSLNQQHLWIKIKNIMDYPLPKANHKMLDILKKLD